MTAFDRSFNMQRLRKLLTTRIKGKAQLDAEIRRGEVGIGDQGPMPTPYLSATSQSSGPRPGAVFDQHGSGAMDAVHSIRSRHQATALKTGTADVCFLVDCVAKLPLRSPANHDSVALGQSAAGANDEGRGKADITLVPILGRIWPLSRPAKAIVHAEFDGVHVMRKVGGECSRSTARAEEGDRLSAEVEVVVLDLCRPVG